MIGGIFHKITSGFVHFNPCFIFTMHIVMGAGMVGLIHIVIQPVVQHLCIMMWVHTADNTNISEMVHYNLIIHQNDSKSHPIKQTNKQTCSSSFFLPDPQMLQAIWIPLHLRFWKCDDNEVILQRENGLNQGWLKYLILANFPEK